MSLTQEQELGFFAVPRLNVFRLNIWNLILVPDSSVLSGLVTCYYPWDLLGLLFTLTIAVTRVDLSSGSELSTARPDM